MRKLVLLIPIAALGCGGAGSRSMASPAVAVAAAGPAVLAGTLPAETHADATDRPVIDLNGAWHFRFDAADTGVTARWFAAGVTGAWDTVRVPGTWDLDHPEGYGRQTVAWYARTFTVDTLPEVPHLRFEGAFREARVWLNGEELGAYDLPYLPFGFDLTGKLVKGANRLAVRIDNRLTRRSLPVDTIFNSGKHGWWPYGGLPRPVYIVDRVAGYAPTVTVTALPGGRITAYLSFAGLPDEVRVSIERRGTPVLDWPAHASPRNTLRYTARLLFPDTGAGPPIWSPETPENVFTLAVKVSRAGHAATDCYTFAFKTFTAERGRFLLNGRDRFLRGMNRHEEHPATGPVFDAGLLASDVKLLTQLHVDFLRPGHYPNDVRTLQAFEQAGIMLAEEVPVYQLDDEQLGDAVLAAQAARAVQTMILRDFNRPGVVMWSLANEIHNWVPNAPAFIQALRDAAKALDPRPVMVAAVTIPPLTTKDISSGIADVVGVNEYWGWYVGRTDDASEYLETVHALFPERTFLISEYGADALYGRRLDGAPAEESVAGHSYSEDFQVYFHERHLDQFERLAFVRGVMPWVFADFRYQWTPTTGDHPIAGRNLKGLVDFDRRPKAAFRILAERYAGYAPAR